MFAKKLGRFTAGLFVALGLTFGGSFLASADGTGATSAAAASTVASANLSQLDFEWN